MTNNQVRVRFAPSPTGGLHLGGVRTALFNYLFAKQHNGKFIVRIEDTDQTRFVEGAEEYIFNCLEWCGIVPDESPKHGGEFGSYRQSERKPMYKQYAETLVQQGFAYYAFDTAEELDAKRKEINNFQYNHTHRSQLRNSLTLNNDEVNNLLQQNVPHVIRIEMPEHENISLHDEVRGLVEFDSSLIDDKVLLKADGMPTYHLAVVVDDYLMKISHVFRGEEWLPSAPVHVLLWKYLFGEENMPKWVHLPLILKPDGNGKLSKRDGDRLGFPVFAMDWKNGDNELQTGFKERGFLPEAFVNMLAMLGWKDNTEKEIFSMKELIQNFSLERVHKHGAKFDYEKAKWYNHEWIKKLDVESLKFKVKDILQQANIEINDNDKLQHVVELVKDRCTLLTDFVEQTSYFFKKPETIDIAAIQPKWNEDKKQFFEALINLFNQENNWQHLELENKFKELATTHNIKTGELLLPLRIMLVGGKFGPHVFNIAELLGKEETVERIKNCMEKLS